MAFWSIIGGAIKGVAGLISGGKKTSTSASSDIQNALANQNQQIANMQAQLTAMASAKKDIPWIPIILGGVGLLLILFLFLRKR